MLTISRFLAGNSAYCWATRVFLEGNSLKIAFIAISLKDGFFREMIAPEKIVSMREKKPTVAC